jgi:hypothetical protein
MHTKAKVYVVEFRQVLVTGNYVVGKTGDTSLPESEKGRCNKELIYLAVCCLITLS